MQLILFRNNFNDIHELKVFTKQKKCVIKGKLFIEINSLTLSYTILLRNNIIKDQ